LLSRHRENFCHTSPWQIATGEEPYWIAIATRQHSVSLR
jgi:hypothetical protein